MVTTPRPSSIAGTLYDPDSALRGLGTGAIAAPMAVSFREEKLALRTSGLIGTAQPDGTPSTQARSDRT